MEKKTMVVGVIVILAVIGVYLYMNGYIPQLNFPSMNGTTAPVNNTNPEAENSGSQISVEISNSAFNPSEITIKTGDSVIWTNMDFVVHTVTSDSGEELMSEGIVKGENYSHTFNIVGTYDYHCSIHTSMKGKIIVE